MSRSIAYSTRTANNNYSDGFGSSYSSLTQTTASSTTNYPPTMTSNTSSGYVITASQSSSTAYYIADNDTTTWTSSNYDSSANYTGSTTTTDSSSNVYSGDWVQISFPVTVRVTYALNRFNSLSGYQASQLLGSNDGSTWTKIVTMPTFSWNAAGSAGSESYISSNTLFFSFYRWVFVTASGGASDGVRLRSVQLTGYPLTNLGVTADITSSGVVYAPNGIVGTLKTSSQPYLSTLSSVNVSSLTSSGSVTALSMTSSGLTCLGASTLQATNVLSLSSSGAISGSVITSSGALNCGSMAVNGGGAGMYFTMASGLSSSTNLAQGCHFSWNTLNGSTGEMDIVNKSGGGNGGICFYNSTGSGSSFSTGQTLMSRMTTSGFVANNITSSGSINAVGSVTCDGLNFTSLLSGSIANPVATGASVGVVSWITYTTPGVYLLFTGISSGSASNSLTFVVHTKIYLCIVTAVYNVQLVTLYNNSDAQYTITSGSPYNLTYNYISGSSTVRAWQHKLF